MGLGVGVRGADGGLGRYERGFFDGEVGTHAGSNVGSLDLIE